MIADGIEATVGVQRAPLAQQMEALGFAFDPKAKAAMERAEADVAALDPGLKEQVRTARIAELRGGALEVAATEMERALREDVKPLDQQIWTLRNQLKGTDVPSRGVELSDVTAKRDELSRRTAQQLQALQVDLSFVAASSDADAIRETALDALASELTPHAARRIGQLALERLRRLTRATSQGSADRTAVLGAASAVETALRAYATAHPTGRERLAVLEQQRVQKVRARQDAFEKLKAAYGHRYTRRTIGEM